MILGRTAPFPWCCRGKLLFLRNFMTLFAVPSTKRWPTHRLWCERSWSEGIRSLWGPRQEGSWHKSARWAYSRGLLYYNFQGRSEMVCSLYRTLSLSALLFPSRASVSPWMSCLSFKWSQTWWEGRFLKIYLQWTWQWFPLAVICRDLRVPFAGSDRLYWQW